MAKNIQTSSPLFNWLESRSAGVLMHPTSLPNQYAIGNLGIASRSFVDLIESCNFKYWQLLPLGPTGFGDSPYQSYSSHAINPLLIDWDDLISKGWISTFDLSNLQQGHITNVDFNRIRHPHEMARRKAMQAGLSDLNGSDEYLKFVQDNKSWVVDYSYFMALRAKNDGKPWYQWPKFERDYTGVIGNEEILDQLKEEIELIQFEQFVLNQQWNELKTYSNSKGIQIIGDIPIYVSPDSVDVWGNRPMFQVTQAGKFSKLAGVPPDYFNADGQFWGNPLYNWKALKEDGYQWWIDRLGHTLSLFDVVRFDHFRALAAYWSIPSNAKTAREGKWVNGPGIEFFEAIKSGLPEAKLILEDLGDITPDVIKLKDDTGCPGLAVLQFAFGGGADNFYLPHNIVPNSVVYTGTHDNDTSRGWYESSSDHEKDHFRRYFRVDGGDACWDLIRSAYASVANMCIVPVQDLLNLDSSSRMNTPGVAEGNWSWRMSHQEVAALGNSAQYLRELAELYRR